MIRTSSITYKNLKSTFKLPAPTGANQNGINRYVMTAPSAGYMVGARIHSDTATSGSDATNRYEFTLKNGTSSLALMSAAHVTSAGELASESPRELTINQNQAFANNDVIELNTDIKDDAGAGPTNISSALLQIEIEWIETVSA